MEKLDKNTTNIKDEFNKTSEEIKVDSKLLAYKNVDLDEIFSIYVNKINPLIVQYEVLSNKFPSEILNEIRAIFTHLARCTMTNDDKIINENISKAKGHAKRATLDCYKYNCMAYTDIYNDFMIRYRNVDLSLIDNGKFLPNITKKFSDAQKFIVDAKLSETNLALENRTNEVYEKYENAYLIYNEVYLNLLDVQEVAENFLNRLIEDKEKEENRRRKELIIGIAGLIFGIIGSIFGLLSMFL